MNYEWFVSLRYLKAKHRHGFISLISLISVAGVAVGVTALIVVLAVMTGFTEELRNKILGINSDVVVQKISGPIDDYDTVRQELLLVPGVKGATPYIYSQIMLTGSGEDGTGTVVRGIDTKTAAGVISLPEQIIAGAMEELSPDQDANQALNSALPGIILGKQLAIFLRVTMGDKVRMFSPSGPLTPMGVIPKIRTCRVVGIFESGMYEYDSTLAYVSLATAQDFMELEETVHGIEVAVTDIYKAADIAGSIEERLGPGFVAKDWIKMNFNLFSALKLEKTAMFIILALIILVAAFNIISTLIMLVIEKGKDIAILKSMGATSGSILRIFIYEGLIIGLSGTFLGVAGGLTLCEILSRYQFIKLPSNVYPMSTLPVEVLPMDVILVAVSSVIITLLATLYPSWQASRVNPATTLRYE